MTFVHIFTFPETRYILSQGSLVDGVPGDSRTWLKQPENNRITSYEQWNIQAASKRQKIWSTMIIQ